METLDNPVWHALDRTARNGSPSARHPRPATRPTSSVFAALPDDGRPEAWDALRGLVGPDGAAFLARNEVALPDGWSVHFDDRAGRCGSPRA